MKKNDFSLYAFRAAIVDRFPELKSAEFSIGITGDDTEFIQIEDEHLTLQWDITGFDLIEINYQILRTLRRYFHEQK